MMSHPSSSMIYPCFHAGVAPENGDMSTVHAVSIVAPTASANGPPSEERASTKTTGCSRHNYTRSQFKARNAPPHLT